MHWNVRGKVKEMEGSRSKRGCWKREEQFSYKLRRRQTRESSLFQFPLPTLSCLFIFFSLLLLSSVCVFWCPNSDFVFVQVWQLSTGLNIINNILYNRINDDYKWYEWWFCWRNDSRDRINHQGKHTPTVALHSPVSLSLSSVSLCFYGHGIIFCCMYLAITTFLSPAIEGEHVTVLMVVRVCDGETVVGINVWFYDSSLDVRIVWFSSICC